MLLFIALNQSFLYITFRSKSSYYQSIQSYLPICTPTFYNLWYNRFTWWSDV